MTETASINQPKFNTYNKIERENQLLDDPKTSKDIREIHTQSKAFATNFLKPMMQQMLQKNTLSDEEDGLFGTSESRDDFHTSLQAEGFAAASASKGDFSVANMIEKELLPSQNIDPKLMQTQTYLAILSGMRVEASTLNKATAPAA